MRLDALIEQQLRMQQFMEPVLELYESMRRLGWDSPWFQEAIKFSNCWSKGGDSLAGVCKQSHRSMLSIGMSGLSEVVRNLSAAEAALDFQREAERLGFIPGRVFELHSPLTSSTTEGGGPLPESPSKIGYGSDGVKRRIGF